MSLPKTINILGYTYKTTLFDDANLQDGFHDGDRFLIGIHKGQTGQAVTVILLHEVLHAIGTHLHLELSEEQINGISQGYFQVMDANPGLFDLKED